MNARIYRQPKSAMQSGDGVAKEWILEWEPASPRRHDPLMGWISSNDTQSQIRLRFETQEEAVAYAQRNNVSYVLELPRMRAMRPKAYADNFRFGRSENWTH
jgi:hypothetical protein